MSNTEFNYRASAIAQFMAEGMTHEAATAECEGLSLDSPPAPNTARTDREMLGQTILDGALRSPHPPFGGAMALELAGAILAAGFARRIPRASSIAVPHTPEEIWAFADVGCDLDFWARTDLEYTEYGVEHIKSGVNITPDSEHMPDELRPDIGEDRVDGY
jgi:hypothetical protein